MSRVGRWVHSRPWVIVGGIALIGASACQDQPSAVPESVAASATLNKGGPAPWIAYSADVETSIQRPGEKRAVYRTRLERRLGDDGVWTSRVTLDHRPSVVPSSRSEEFPKSIELSDEGKIIAVLDQKGRQLNVDELRKGPTGFFPGQPREPLRQSLPKRGVAQPADPHAWLDQFVVTRDAADRIENRLSRQMARAADREGRKRFVRGGEASTELLVDAASGGVVEETITRNGQRVHHATHSYAPYSPGVSVRTTSRTESIPDGKSEPIIIERRYSNIQLLRGTAK